MRWPLASLLGASVLLASSAAASPAAPAALSRRAPVPAGGDVDFYNPLNRTGGHMLSVSWARGGARGARERGEPEREREREREE
jgi:hypothetical protein